jgi:hypothetical protein
MRANDTPARRRGESRDTSAAHDDTSGIMQPARPS